MCRRGCNSPPLRRFRNLPLIPCRSGDGHGLTTIYWNARDVAGIKVHIGSLSDSLFAVGGSKGFATTGQWATNGIVTLPS